MCSIKPESFGAVDLKTMHLQKMLSKSHESGLLAVGVCRPVVESRNFLFILGLGCTVSHSGHQLRETQNNVKDNTLVSAVIN